MLANQTQHPAADYRPLLDSHAGRKSSLDAAGHLEDRGACNQSSRCTLKTLQWS